MNVLSGEPEILDDADLDIARGGAELAYADITLNGMALGQASVRVTGWNYNTKTKVEGRR